jgi:hypothetical protein
MDIELFSKLPNDLLKKIAVLADIEHEKDIGAYLVKELGARKIKGFNTYEFTYRHPKVEGEIGFSVFYDRHRQQVLPCKDMVCYIEEIWDFAEYVYVRGGVQAIMKLGLEEFLEIGKRRQSFVKKRVDGSVMLKRNVDFKFENTMTCIII